MKKIILIMLVVTAFCSSNSSAQNNTSDYREKLSLGFKIGVNYSNVYDEEGQSFVADPKLGLATGAFFLIPIGKYIGIQPEILFSQKGFKATSIINGNRYEFTRTTNYIDIPLLLSIKPVESITLLVGPQYSFLMKQSDSFSNSTNVIQQNKDFENDNIRRNVLCFLGGVDFNFEHVVFGLRTGWDIQNNNGDGTTSAPRYKNVWYQATIGFRL